mmetsp:Transcript_19441/g.28814  ORF Transcript_19441/g.28814 Transcript_19441/m.28814 type:complete len:201 (-) Transcript_19441:488-1090(-)
MTRTFERYEEEFQILTSQIQKYLGAVQDKEEDNPPVAQLSQCSELIKKMEIDAKQQRNPEKEDLLSRLDLYIVQHHTLQTHCLHGESDELITKLPEQEKARKLFSDLASQFASKIDAKESNQGVPASSFTDRASRFFPKIDSKQGKERSEDRETVDKPSFPKSVIRDSSEWFKSSFTRSSGPAAHDADCWDAAEYQEDST